MRFASHYSTTFELQFCLLLHCFFFHHSRYQVDDTRHVLTKTTKHTFSAVTIPNAASLAEYVSVVTVAFGTEYYVLGLGFHSCFLFLTIRNGLHIRGAMNALL